MNCDQLTKARAYLESIVWGPDDTWVEPLAEAARILSEFPTDEHVEAALGAFSEVWPWSRIAKGDVEFALEVVRDQMFGDDS